MLRSCGLAALLALSAVAEPPAQSTAPSAAPAIQAVKKPAPVAPDRITSSDDRPVQKVTAPAVTKPSAPKAPALVEQKSGPAVMPPARPGYPDEQKMVEKPAARPAAATPAPAKITESAPAAKPAAAAPAPAKVTESAPAAKPAAAAPAPAKVTESAPAAKPAAAAPAPAKVTESAPVAKPAAATPAPTKITESAPVAKPAAAAPAPAKVTESAPAAKPAAATGAPAKASAAVSPAQAEALSDLVFPQAKTELKRLMIGNQAGIVKVLGPNREGVSYVRGIDDKNIARYCDDSCGSIFCALGISHDKLNKVAQEIMINYSTLPRKEAVAFLGAVAASTHLTPDMDAKAEEFLVKVMEADKDVHARRQAVLALAVKHNVCSATTERVLGLFERSENLWETFPVQQYFEYHAAQVKRLANFSQVRERIAAVKSLYTPAILQALDDSKPVTVVP
ncbi:MAG: hypothetical protein U0931_23765 [Vulcanimicrobiota bacterium]